MNAGGVPAVSRGLSESASDTPGTRVERGMHPAGMPAAIRSSSGGPRPAQVGPRQGCASSGLRIPKDLVRGGRHGDRTMLAPLAGPLAGCGRFSLPSGGLRGALRPPATFYQPSGLEGRNVQLSTPNAFPRHAKGAAGALFELELLDRSFAKRCSLFFELRP